MAKGRTYGANWGAGSQKENRVGHDAPPNLHPTVRSARGAIPFGELKDIMLSPIIEELAALHAEIGMLKMRLGQLEKQQLTPTDIKAIAKGHLN